MNKPASELIARLEVSQRACFDAGLHVAAMDIQSARAEIARTAANQSGSERAGVGARGPVEVKQVHKLRHLLNHMPDKDFHLPREEAQELLRYIEALANSPAQPAPASEPCCTSNYGDYTPVTVRGSTSVHGKPDGAVREALRNLLDYAEQRECSHEATHRGGSIWTICDECGKKWADDRGGFIPYQEPKEITQARAALHSPKIAAADDDVETCIACNIAFVEGDMVYPDASGGSIHASCCGPERESYANADGEPLKDGDPMPTPQRWTSAAAETSPGDVRTESSKQYRDAVDSVNRSTDREIADALAMKEACKRAVTELDCMYVNGERIPYGGIPADPESSVWREAIKAAEAAIDRLDVTPEAKSQEPDAVMWRVRSFLDQYEVTSVAAIATHWRTCGLDVEPLYTHPTKAPAVSVDAETIEAAARIIDPTAWKMEHGYWMERAHAYEAISKATAIAALIAGGR